MLNNNNNNNNNNETNVGKHSWIVTFLLWLFLGPFHRFYVGKIVSGIFYFITLGGIGIWWIVDGILIITGKFKDKEGKLLMTNSTLVIPITTSSKSNINSADELKKWNEMYKEGIITKEEFEQKKSEFFK